jgi:hypothetical protein
MKELVEEAGAFKRQRNGGEVRQRNTSNFPLHSHIVTK